MCVRPPLFFSMKFVTLFGVIALLSSTTVVAKDADPFLVRAKELMDEAEYKKAAKVIRQGLAREEVSGDELVEHYLLEGICNVSIGKTGNARSSFAKILTINPRYRLDASVSPKVRDVFEETLAEMVESLPASSITAIHTPVGTRPPGAPVPVRVAFDDDGAKVVERVVVFVRRTGTSEYAAVDAVRGDDGFVGEIPATFVGDEKEAYAVDYYIDVFDAGDARVSAVGARQLPLSFLVASRAELAEGLDDGVPLWIPIGIGAAVVGVVVVGAASAVGAFFYLQSQDPRGSATVTVRQ